MVLRFKLFPPRCRCAIQRAVPVKTLPLLKGVSSEEAKGVFGHVENIIAFARNLTSRSDIPSSKKILRLEFFPSWTGRNPMNRT